MHARWYQRPRDPGEVIELVELRDARDTNVHALSGGQRRRLDLALGLIGDPDVLFLDEPTTGFDPHARRQAWSTIRALCAEGRTVVLTTHFMDEAQALADRVAVMREGEIVAQGHRLSSAAATPRRPRSGSSCRGRVLGRSAAARLGPRLRRPDGRRDDRASDRTTHALTGWAIERGLDLPGLTVERPSLEDVYLSLTEEVAA